MKDLRKAALQYAMSLAKMDKEAGAPEEETRSTTPIAVAAFIAGAEWQKKEFDKLPRSKRYRSIAKHNYCDECVHFRPDEEGERKPVNELCEFVRPLKFKMPTDDEFLNSDDWGFYLPKCKDYKRIDN